MSTRKVILELSPNARLARNFMATHEDAAVTLDTQAAPKLETVQLDTDFPATALPALKAVTRSPEDLFDTAAPFSFDLELDAATFIVRGEIAEGQEAAFEAEVKKSRAVVGFYADVAIAPMMVCPGSPAVGSDADVERLLCTSRLHRCGMDGRGVLVAIVDSGVNLAYLNGRGKTPTFDAARSWAWDPAAVTPGSAPVGHGTMCAYDACIAAPRCTILDVALLRPISAAPGGSLMEGLLSDAIRAYRHLVDVMSAPQRPGENRSLVVNNSWGMFHPSWDWPVGHAANYSDNPNHPFNRIVVTLERAGADILFAAGNCGANCPDGRCASPPGSPPVTAMAIYGANSSPAVTCVAGVDTTKVRAGYSAIGPGRLATNKPDLSGYTHFSGSGVYAADGGTSAATPVVAGVVAALRSQRPFSATDPSTRPAAIRNFLTSTAEDLGTSGYDFEHGHGVVSGCAIARRLCLTPKPPISLCVRYPWICDPRWLDICRRYPRLCALLPRPKLPIPPIPPIRLPPRPLGFADMGGGVDAGDAWGEGLLAQLLDMTEDGEDTPDIAPDMAPEEVAYLMGYLLGQQEASGGEPASAKPKKDDCGCK